MKPTYFDLTVEDVEEAMRFFGEIFGWTFERFPMSYPYFRIQAGTESEAGIDGGIGAVADAPAAAGLPTTQVTIPVPDLDTIVGRWWRPGGGLSSRKWLFPGSDGTRPVQNPAA